MSKQVFIFESDTGFAGEVEQALAPLDVAVTVLTDPDAGIGQVVKTRPDLVLLSVELLKGNGFSVCNKLKRDEAVKAIPVVILSATATDETFRQHRSLRTRADAYLHKPIPVSELLRQLQPFLPIDLGPSHANESAEVPESQALESSDVAFSEPPDQEAPRVGDASELSGASEDRDQDGVSIDVDERPELTDADFAAAGSAPPTARAQSTPPFADATADADIEQHLSDVIDLEDEEDLHISVPPPDSGPHAAEAEGPRLGGTVTRLSQSPPPKSDDELRRDELLLARDQEVKRLKREIERLKATPQTSASGQAREFLDLRERLNKKDKELLDQREQLHERDKELLGLRDSVIDFERRAADHAERNVELERQLAELQKGLDAALRDKDQASKRSDDFKRMLDKVKAELDAKTAEFSEFREESTREASEAIARAEAAGRSELERGLEEAREKHERALAEALDQARAEDAATHRAELDRLRHEFESERAARQRAQDEMLVKVRAEYELEGEERARVQAEAHRLELEGQKGALESLHRAVVDDRQRRHVAELAEQAEATEAALGEGQRLQANIDALEGKYQSLEATTRELQTDLAAVLGTLEAKESLLENARTRIAEDRVSFRETKEALLEAVRVLEAGEGRSLE